MEPDGQVRGFYKIVTGDTDFVVYGISDIDGDGERAIYCDQDGECADDCPPTCTESGRSLHSFGRTLVLAGRNRAERLHEECYSRRTPALHQRYAHAVRQFALALTGTAMADSPLPPEGSVCESSLS